MSNNNQDENFFSFLRIINIFKVNWYWFIVSIFFFSFLALMLNRYTQMSYENNTTIHISNDENNLTSLLGENKFSSVNFTDEISFISSYPTILKTVKELGLNVSYFIKGDIKTVETFDWRPITLVPYNLEQNYGLNVIVKVLDENSFELSINDNDFNVYKFGQKINYENGYFVILFNETFEIGENNFITYY